jgi:glucose-6-phosphate isomerase
MKTPSIAHTEQGPLGISLDWNTGHMTGSAIKSSEKRLGDLSNIFRDEKTRSTLAPDQIIYRVQWYAPIDAGSEGGLFWGVTIIEPGKVAGEYFMTHGHFHANRSSAEYYGTIRGHGMLIQMDDDRRTWGEPMSPGSLHYIDGRYAHRVANAGDEPLAFWACWPSDAGYDYDTIAQHGFGARLVERNGKPSFVPND